MNDKKTAVEWLSENLVNEMNFDYWSAIEKALQMEKQQIIDAYRDGRSDQQSERQSKFYNRMSEQYYNETFKKNQHEPI
jgi:hypothetical protein